METLIVDDLTRSFMLHLPKEPFGRPLVIALHPLGSNPVLMEAMTNFSELADEQGFIAAYPEGTKASRLGVRSWNAGFCCQDAMANMIDDVGFISELISSMVDRYGVKGVLVTGFSNGGMLAHLAGIELSDKVNAIAPVASTIGPETLDHCPFRPVPAILIAGTADHVVPFGFSNNHHLLPGAEAITYWARCNGCDSPPSIEMKDGTIEERYVPRLGGAELFVIKVKDAGHVWPGSKVRMRSENDPQTLDASRAIWEFFKSKLG